MMYKGLLFDLDGVVVDTAKHHYIAWKQIAGELGIDFTPSYNERLKGVSRGKSLEIILEIGDVMMTPAEREDLCSKKNDIYLKYIGKLTENDILPGVRQFLTDARSKGYATALGTASKNSTVILNGLKIKSLFDAIVDGNSVVNTKPDPEVFTKCADALQVPYAQCVVYEDSAAGLQAAHRCGMKAVGIGKASALKEADIVIPGFENITIVDIENLLKNCRYR